MENYKEYTDQKLLNILQRLNEDLEKEKYLEFTDAKPSIVTKTYKMCIDNVTAELTSRGYISSPLYPTTPKK